MRADRNPSAERSIDGALHHFSIAGVHSARDVRGRDDVENRCIPGCTGEAGVLTQISVQIDCRSLSHLAGSG